MELKRILIVEDDADIAAIERDYLELGGYAVTIAPDGTTGLDAALHQPFDLIFAGCDAARYRWLCHLQTGARRKGYSHPYGDRPWRGC